MSETPWADLSRARQRPGVTEWGDPEPIYVGEALVDLHGGKGTKWVRDTRGYWPDCCDAHRPKAIIDERKRR